MIIPCQEKKRTERAQCSKVMKLISHLVRRDFHRKIPSWLKCSLMAILAASSWNGGTVEQEIETRLPDLGKLFTREEALKEMEDRSIYSSL